MAAPFASGGVRCPLDVWKAARLPSRGCRPRTKVRGLMSSRGRRAAEHLRQHWWSNAARSKDWKETIVLATNSYINPVSYSDLIAANSVGHRDPSSKEVLERERTYIAKWREAAQVERPPNRLENTLSALALSG